MESNSQSHFPLERKTISLIGQKEYKEIASLFPCCPVNCKYLWKKTKIEKKGEFSFTTCKYRLLEYDG